jgi:hypothetical protein
LSISAHFVSLFLPSFSHHIQRSPHATPTRNISLPTTTTTIIQSSIVSNNIASPFSPPTRPSPLQHSRLHRIYISQSQNVCHHSASVPRPSAHSSTSADSRPVNNTRYRPRLGLCRACGAGFKESTTKTSGSAIWSIQCFEVTAQASIAGRFLVKNTNLASDTSAFWLQFTTPSARATSRASLSRTPTQQAPISQESALCC